MPVCVFLRITNNIIAKAPMLFGHPLEPAIYLDINISINYNISIIDFFLLISFLRANFLFINTLSRLL